MTFLRRLASPTITVKISLAFSLLLMTLLVETAIGYGALTAVLKSNQTILANAEMQRLVMGMSRNWETVKLYRHRFFYQAAYLGVDQAYDQYALPAGGKITEVIRDGASLKRLVSSALASPDLQAREPDINAYLATVSQYATTFEEMTGLETRLFAEKSGLQSQLEGKATELAGALPAGDQAGTMLAPYYAMRYFEKDLTNLELMPVDQTFEAADQLRQAIENSSIAPQDRQAALGLLAEYEDLVDEIVRTVTQIQEKRASMDLLDQDIGPILIKLLVTVDTEVGMARLRIEETRQKALRALWIATIFGLISASVIAVLLHHSVTRKIINLTRITNQFHTGNMEARARIDSSDELGDLGKTFNEMAESVQRLNAELREEAIRDPLTGLFNRRYLDETLPRELARADRDGIPIALVMIDLDHLKIINDTFGHAIGDQILKNLGQLLSSQSRHGDIACRIGGDEFLILLLNARLTDAAQRSRDWQTTFAEMKAPSPGEPVSTTLSIGVVEWLPGETPSDLYARVDRVLYLAKNSGRNRVATQENTAL